MVSHESEDGRVFNSTFFEDDSAATAFLAWYNDHALTGGGQFHSCLAGASAEGEELPTGETLLFGRGSGVLDDTRFGEYQLGMSVRYSVATFRSAAMEEEARAVGTSAAFERRIAEAMTGSGISYFGRLVMKAAPAEPGGPPRWITASRYGSLQEATAGTALVRRLCEDEMARWFTSYDTIIGTASRVLDQ